MPKMNVIDIDERGNVSVEFKGYDGRECEKEEEELRRELAVFGITVEIAGRRRKTAAEIAAEAEAGSASRTKVKV